MVLPYFTGAGEVEDNLKSKQKVLAHKNSSRTIEFAVDYKSCLLLYGLTYHIFTI